jgi:N-acetylneuraminic acid mutarotase
MAYDPTTGKVIVFGGMDVDYSVLRDTWILDPLAKTWTDQKLSPSPRARQAASMVYEPATRRMILFGGDGPYGVLGDTWAYDPATNTWSQLHPSVSPPARSSHAMVFDPVTGKIIMFGGVDWDLRNFGDTWAFDPATTTWTQIHTTHSPDARDSCVMASVTASGRIVLFGGESWSAGSQPEPTALGDTWLFDPAEQDWARLETSVSPQARDSASLVWSASSGMAILFGGEVYAGDVSFGDVWAFDPDTNEWAPVETEAPPSHRDCHTMVDTGTAAGMILFGGVQNMEVLFGDVWSYDPGQNRWEQLLGGSTLPTS